MPPGGLSESQFRVDGWQHAVGNRQHSGGLRWRPPRRRFFGLELKLRIRQNEVRREPSRQSRRTPPFFAPTLPAATPFPLCFPQGIFSLVTFGVSSAVATARYSCASAHVLGRDSACLRQCFRSAWEIRNTVTGKRGSANSRPIAAETRQSETETKRAATQTRGDRLPAMCR